MVQVRRKGLHVFAATVLFLVGACGGGGGGGSDSGGGPPLPPPPSGNDTTFGTLALDRNNADAIGLAISLSEGALAVYQAAINAVINFASPRGMPVRSCGNSGTLSVSLLDNDTSFGISAGDTLDVIFTDCYDTIVDGTVNGSLSIVVSQFALDGGSARLAGDLTFPAGFTIIDPADPSVVADVSGSGTFDFVLDAPEVLTVQATGDQDFAVRIGNITERMRNFVLTKTATRLAPGSSAANVDTQVTIDTFYVSELLGGSFTCTSSDLAFDGNISGIALRASVTCTGLNRSAVRITNQNEVGVDPEGDGTFEDVGLFDWDLAIDGFLATDSGLVLDEIAGDIPIGRITMRANDVTWDWGRDRLLVTTKADDPSFPNTLLEISLINNIVRPLATYLDEPNLVELSEDGSRLYVTFTGSPEIRPYDAATFQSLPLIMVTSDETISPDYAVLDIAVSPADANRIAVAFQFVGTGTTDVVIIDGDAQMANTYRDASGGSGDNLDVVEFSQDGARVFGGTTRSTGGHVLDVDANGVSGTTFIQSGFSGRFQRVDGQIYSGNTVYDDTSLVRVGSYRSTPGLVGIDLPNIRTFVLQGSQLGVFERDTFLSLATYDLGLDPLTTIDAIVPAGGKLVLVEEDSLYFLNVADFVTTNTGECLVETLATNENENYTRFGCPVTDVAYDEARGSIYAALDSSLGINGNSIAVIDSTIDLVNLYVYVGSEPSAITISGDGRYLYVLFDGADVMKTIDLDSLQIIRELPLELEMTAVGPAPREGLALVASPVENDSVIVTLAEFAGSPFTEYALVRDGARLPDEVSSGDLQGTFENRDPRLFFDAAGTAYVISQDATAAAVQTLGIGPTGLSAGPSFSVDPAQVGDGQVDVSQAEVFTALGAVIDLGTQSGGDRYDSLAMSFDDTRGGLAINADTASNDVYVLVGTNLNTTGIGRYDYASGALVAEQELAGFPASFFSRKLIDVGADRLAVLVSPDAGLLVIDKAIIQ